MHSVMKLASALAPDNSIIQNLAFSLLANLVMSRDCRCLLQKVRDIMYIELVGKTSSRLK